MIKLIKNITISLVLILSSSFGCYAADGDSAEGMDRFFELLKRLEENKDTVINVVHLGDSHIQAGYLTQAVRRPMQQRFGNSGRGWISPLKLSKTNEPSDYFVTSLSKEWIAGRAIQRDKKTVIGPGGMGLKSQHKNVDFGIIIAPINGAGYSFDKVMVYRDDTASPLKPGNNKDAVVSVATAPFAEHMSVDTIDFKCMKDTCRLLNAKNCYNNTYYGFNLVNDSNGVLYHSVGINGAMYVSYTDSSYVKRLSALSPDLLIVSLGTNETFGRNFQSDVFESQVKDFLSLVKLYMPNTCVMLTTPPEVFKKTYKDKKRIYVRNQSSERAAAVISKVAKEENIACFDLFSALGGKGSSAKLLKNSDLSRDHVHFTKEGYAKQGQKLYDYIMNSYNNYLNR